MAVILKGIIVIISSAFFRRLSIRVCTIQGEGNKSKFRLFPQHPASLNSKNIFASRWLPTANQWHAFYLPPATTFLSWKICHKLSDFIIVPNWQCYNLWILHIFMKILLICSFPRFDPSHLYASWQWVNQDILRSSPKLRTTMFIFYSVGLIMNDDYPCNWWWGWSLMSNYLPTLHICKVHLPQTSDHLHSCTFGTIFFNWPNSLRKLRRKITLSWFN